MIGNLNDALANFGYVVIGIFIVSWAISYFLYRWQRLDEPLVEHASER
jgi:high-affinity nickel-transport protein